MVISIKPKNGDFISDFDKEQIAIKLKNYATISGVNQQIVDLKVLFVEIDSAVYYNSSQVVDVSGLQTKVSNTLNTFAEQTSVSLVVASNIVN